MNDIWWTQEVIGDNAEAAEIQPRNYLKTGQVNEFQYAYRLKSLFSNPRWQAEACRSKTFRRTSPTVARPAYS